MRCDTYALINDIIVLLNLYCLKTWKCESQNEILYVWMCGMWLLMMLLSMIILIWGDVVIDGNIDMRMTLSLMIMWYEMMLLLMIILKWDVIVVVVDDDDVIEMGWCWCW